MRQVADIVRARRDQNPVVVVSAIAGATDALLDIGQKALAGETRRAQEKVGELAKRHKWLLFDLGLDKERERSLADLVARVQEELNDYVRGIVLLRELSPRVRDRLQSFGERLCCALLESALSAHGVESEWVDARDIFVTDGRFGEARVDRDELGARAERFNEVLGAGRVPVTQGFVGATESGETTTLGRGGSDYTASLIGAALGADEIQIWTDVDGMLTADHRLVENSMKIRELSYEEASELAYFGVKVLHPSSIEPALEKSIPVRVLNSLRPDSTGTIIKARASRSGIAVKSIAAKKGITVVNVQSPRMLMAHGFLKAIFEVFDRHETVVDLVSTSEVSVSLTVDADRGLADAVSELSAFSDVRVEHGYAIVCLVGEELRSTPGIAARTFKVLGDVNVHMISQGASEINLSFVVREEAADDTVRRLHDEFFRDVGADELFEPVDAEASR